MSHEIRIFVVNGQLQYIHHDTAYPNDDDPGDPVQLSPGEVVKWKCRDGDFTIDFAGSPFVSLDTHIAGVQKKLTKSETLIDPGPIPALPTFKYTVTVVGVPPDDPEIIIDNSGGGPAPKKAAKKKAKVKAQAKK